MLTAEELQAGVARNNARALDPARWRLRWIHLQVVPTGTFFQVPFQIPPSCAVFRLDYLMAFWPVTGGAFRPLFIEVADTRGEKFIFLDNQSTGSRNGMNMALFTTPTTDPNSTLAGDQAQYLGAMPLGLEFPGRDVLLLNVRGALATPNPATIDFLLAGHARTEV